MSSWALVPAASHKGLKADPAGQYEAVTLAISKKKGANASVVAEDALKRLRP